jgi:hypothetical protein
MSGDVWLNEMITVCDNCLMASCWQGIYYCEEAERAGAIKKSRAELITLNLEHQDFWKTDEQLKEGK